MNNILLALFTFILGSLTAILADPIKQFLKRTDITLIFDEESCMIRSPDAQHGEAIYINLKIFNPSKSKYALKVRPFIILAEGRINENSSWQAFFDTPLPLAWSYLGYEDSHDLPPQMWHFFSIVYINKDENLLRPTTRIKPLLWEKYFKEFSFFRITFFVSGENLKVLLKGSIEVKLNNDDWANIKITNVNFERVSELPLF